MFGTHMFWFKVPYAWSHKLSQNPQIPNKKKVGFKPILTQS